MNPALYWNAVLLEASRRDFTRGFNNAQQPGPIRTAYAMAIVHIAIHDVIALRTNATRSAAYLEKKGVAHGIASPNDGSRQAMIAGAAGTTLKALYPNYVAFIDDSLGSVDPGDFAFGVSVGQAVLVHRWGSVTFPQNPPDGSNTMLTRPQPISPVYGQHRADPYQPNQNQLGPVWGEVTRFLETPHQPLDDYPGKDLPNLLSNSDYLADFEEVRDLGSVVRGARSAEQQRIGVYWGYDGANNLGVPPRLYNQVARKIVENRNLNLSQTAELLAIINVAMADAGIDAWHYKYTNDLWRPVVGVRQEMATEGGDPFWAPLGAPQTNVPGLATFSPNFPAYPSGHATFGAALFQALRLSLQTASGPISLQDVLDADPDSGAQAPIPEETFTFVSDELDGIASDCDGSRRTRVEKEFTSFAEAIWENSVSRIYLGVHWRFDGIPRDATTQPNIGGVPLGLAVGEEAYTFFNTGASLAGST